MMLATVQDVQRLLPEHELDELPPNDYIEALLEEASDLVEAFTGRTFNNPPDSVRRVVARMVVRTIVSTREGDSRAFAFGASSVANTAGPFTNQTTFPEGSTDGGVWLSKQDKTRLRRFCGGVGSVDLGHGRSVMW